ncbi:hydroxymethylbilane synthase [Macrococcoides bohemicum]|uniref:Porphobilinogen deaminase n=1 Tax=Macrococcoides bohemicum TaxID=1903056 RepID=A0A328AAY1_9STAP|nr:MULTISPECIES: hydroxymethylbilane synthase [Macrococcus]ATD30092.1 hydroxymethylbilane synthase [Macrococcus sp. IME1552]MBC9873804.1 hydroxymethylbilane synthase [Macrococcus bohemicus]QRN50210.1 hydroxymethylbilane synthase [Macrococcus bohemicus]QYA41635.1 hydroxymethylbilane synthase [Macrococcus bohemicus]RAK50218.1 hydroxymethylbilane synthase [Macrococcus bohemicus]
MKKFIVGSRRSQLALTQSKQFIAKLKEKNPGVEIEIKEIVTKGDQIVNVQLSKVGGKGLFVKEIEAALYNKEIDFAIHSLKDVPSELPEGLTLGCIPDREDARDAFISKGHIKLSELKEGAIVGTSSLRRGAQILNLYPHLKIEWIRGNIDTRLRKLETENFDAIILAAAGLNRMGWGEDIVTEYLDPETMLPAIGQGALGIECRIDDLETLSLLATVHNSETEVCTQAEREFLKLMDGSCQVPIAGHAVMSNDKITFTGLIMSTDGKEKYKVTEAGTDPVVLGAKVAEAMQRNGAQKIIETLNNTPKSN